MIRFLLCGCLLLIFLISCTDNNSNSPFGIDFGEEHSKIEWDSISTANELLGSWNLTHRYCCPEGSSNKFENVTSEKYRLTFTETKMIVYKNDVLIQTSDWHMEIADAGLYGIKSTPQVDHTYGQILFASNRLLFKDSNRDGADNYYIRME